MPAATLLLVALSLAVAWVPGGAAAAELDRSLVQAEPWRLLSGHLAHFNTSHFVYDAAVLLAFGLFAEPRWPRATRLALGLSAVLIPLVLLLAAPAITTYRGLSGLDSTLFALLVTRLHVERAFGGRWTRWLPALAGLGFIAKLAFEFASGAALFADTQALFVPVPLAHLVGATLGLAVGLLPMSSCASAPCLPNQVQLHHLWPERFQREGAPAKGDAAEPGSVSTGSVAGEYVGSTR